MALNVWDCDYFPGKNTMSKQELLAEIEKLRRTMRLHAGDCCSLNNEVELFRGHWEDAEERCKELERENKRLKIWLDQYDADATKLIEEYGADPDDKIDREVLKRMLNCLIGKNRTLTNKSKELEGEIEVQKQRVILSERMSKEFYCRVCKHQKRCNEKDPDKCKCFEMKQDNNTWYLEGSSGIRHPLDMD